MDIARYKELKALKLTKLEKNKKDKLELVIDRFDVATGEKIESEREDVEAHIFNLKVYKDQLVDIQARIAALEELKADVEKMEVKGG